MVSEKTVVDDQVIYLITMLQSGISRPSSATEVENCSHGEPCVHYSHPQSPVLTRQFSFPRRKLSRVRSCCR